MYPKKSFPNGRTRGAGTFLSSFARLSLVTNRDLLSRFSDQPRTSQSRPVSAAHSVLKILLSRSTSWISFFFPFPFVLLPLSEEPIPLKLSNALSAGKDPAALPALPDATDPGRVGAPDEDTCSFTSILSLSAIVGGRAMGARLGVTYPFGRSKST